MIAPAIIALVWVLCGVFAYALTLGHFTAKYGDTLNGVVSVFVGLLGPCGLFAIAVNADRPLRLVWCPLSYEERLMLFRAKYPNLSLHRFEGYRGEDRKDDLALLKRLKEKSNA